MTNDINSTASQTMIYLIEHSKDTIAILSILIALISLLATFYFRRREANHRDKELDIKTKQFDLEKRHQISKEKYQELFEEKIEVYKQLYSEINKFKKQLYEVGKYFDTEDAYGKHKVDEITIEDVNIKTLKSLFKLIDENHFLISEKLMDNYGQIYDLYRKHTAEFDFMMDVGAYGTPDELDSKWEKIKNDFYEKYKRSIESFFNQIELEIRKMKQVLEN